MYCLILSGSARKNSNTLRFSNAVHKIITEQNHESHVVDFNEYDFPNFNQGSIDWENPSDFQLKIRDHFSKAQIVFVHSPEYNWMPSAEILQFFNQFATNKHLPLFHNKVFAMAGTSSGRGGRMPAVQLSNVVNKILGFFDGNAIVSPKIFEAQFVPQVIAEDGSLQENLEFNKGIRAFVQGNLALTEALLSK
jgi:chromate reductase, NAD(P)H dehydrogenase (quinone)